MNHPLPPERLPSLVAKATDPALSLERKLAVARGVLPMMPEQLVLCLYQLCHDADQGVSRLARDTLAGMPEEVLAGAVAKLDSPEPLDFLAGLFSSNVRRMEAIVLHRVTANETLERVARSCTKNVAELIAQNQERLLKHPAIIEGLYLNKNTRMSTVDRIISFAVRQGLVLEGIPAFREIAAAMGAEVKQPTGAAAPADACTVDRIFDRMSAATGESRDDEDQIEVAACTGVGATMTDDSVFDEFDRDGKGGLPADVFSEFDRDASRDEAQEGGQDGGLSLDYEMSTMSIPQKIRLAILGTAAHRALLISDSNKLVSMAAIKSPTITDQEVVRYSTSRAVSEDVIRFIAAKREWTRNYFVKVNLVNNPKTPIATAMQFLVHMQRRDLKNLTGNKNVSAALTTAAKNLMRNKEQASGQGQGNG